MAEFATAAELVAADIGNVHVECGRDTSAALLAAFRARYRSCRRACVVDTDRGSERDTVASHLRFFSRLAGGAVHHEDAIAHFGLRGAARARLRDLAPAQVALVNLARASLVEPEACFIERPLSDLDAAGRAAALTWIEERTACGCRFVTACEPLREALLLPGRAFWHEDGRFIEAEVDEGGAPDGDGGTEGPVFAGDEVRVCKIPAKTDAATLLFDPREIDFIESMSKQNYVSVRGTLYPTPLTMDELDEQLGRFGFFRCHRSFIVNVQKVAKVERYTRNSFNLTLNDAARTSVPLAKGRAEEMRERYGW
ncbi:LytTR family DNA-binding domain-containing protein [Arabiibacter massiliensis]|uniref:LytTR family DNA-binding domain-containing protein n=1 Tax=Arabiibacter massiliensis TaxID=1870985 RepID=UPI0009BAA4BC|nr:LytTR family transcriptional regulator DNA-binding domain-containing protein [Arabiibacter massiliensis]